MDEPKRWNVSVTYRVTGGLVHSNFDIDELEELQKIVEGGPNWYSLININIVLINAGSEGIRTIQQTLTE